MLDSIILLAFCLLAGVIALAICVYLYISGQLLTLDGLLLALLSLTMGGIFALNVAWSIYTGELKQIMGSNRKNPDSAKPSDQPTDKPST